MSTEPAKALFDVEHSFMASRWVARDAPIEQVERAARQHDLPEAVARLLLTRGIKPEDITDFLKPTLKNNLPSPFFMQDMEPMADYICAAIQDKKSFAIFGDFDVDGATSSALLKRFLKMCGFDAPVYIPDRLLEGYGPNIEAFKKLASQGAQIIFILDCGSTSFETIRQGRELGLEFIILDHHQTEGHLPEARFMINPKRHDDGSGLDMLAACGVTFMACIAINNKLRSAEYYAQRNIPEPDLRSLLDLVALGTVCDMVPLTSINRLFVKQGFQQIQQTKNTGLLALIETARITGEVGTYHAGFVLGPRINAGGRIQKSDLGAILLSTDDHEEAVNIAWKLSDCNDQRKEIQIQMESEAFAKIEKLGLDQGAVIIVGDESWHPGLSGLVAGKIKDRYGKPACVITYTKSAEGVMEGRGSGRSIPGINMGRAFMDAVEAGLIPKGGGHAMAGGFTLYPEQLDAFSAFIQENVAGQADGKIQLPEMEIDGILTISGAAKIELTELLEREVGPFGQDFPEPLFAFKKVQVHAPTIRGGSHISVMLSDAEGGTRIKAMAFGAVGTELGNALLGSNQKLFNIIGHLKINEWQGRRSAELHIKDGSYYSYDAAPMLAKSH